MDDKQQQQKAHDHNWGHNLRAGFRRLKTKVFKPEHLKSPVGSPSAAPLQATAAAASTAASTAASSTSVPVATAEVDEQPAPESDPSELKPRARTISSSNITLAHACSDSNAPRRHSSALPDTTATIVPVAVAPVSMALTKNQIASSASSPGDEEQFDEFDYDYDTETARKSTDSADSEGEGENEENQDADARKMSRSDSNSSAGGTSKNAISGLKLGLATAEGLMGHANEDRIIVEQNKHFQLLAVLDGHGGGWTADFVKDKLFTTVARCYDSGFDPLTLAAAIDSLDQEVQGKATQMQDYSGTCMVCVLLFVDGEDELQTLTLNVGDCRAILHEARAKGKKANKGMGPNGRLYALSEDHCEANKKETARVLASGAYIEYGRIGGVLEPFRSIGDIDMKERDMDGWVIATPEIKKTRLLLGRSTLVLATDGVWGSLTNQKVMALVRQSLSNLQAGADAIVTAARAAGSLDDIAVIVAQI